MTAAASKVPVPDARQKKARRVYKTPPIYEAVCEFHFLGPEAWTLAHSGLFMGRVKVRYSGKPSEQRLLRMSMPFEADAVNPALNEITKVQLRSESGTEMVAVGAGTLTVHSLKPYSGWERFREQIAEALNEYRAVVSPTGIRRIGIRYINQITIPTARGVPDDFITTPPYGIPSIPVTVAAFSLRHEYVRDDSIRAVVQLASLNSPPDTYALGLDVDVTRIWQGDGLRIDDALAFVDKLRDEERDIFEALITDKARELFDE